MRDLDRFAPCVVVQPPLRQCPFCGASVAHVAAMFSPTGCRVICVGAGDQYDKGCGAAGPVCVGDTPDEACARAAEAWNRRPEGGA